MLELSIRHILFPFDFSCQAHAAARYVTAFAKRFGAHVSMLSVVPSGYATVPATMGGTAIHASERSEEWKRALKCRLDRELLTEFSGVDVERVVDCGDAALRIEDFAHNADVDLVMMPTHGLGVFRALLAGSVASKVLHDVRCPIWTAAHAYTQRAPELPRSIVCAVDATNEGVPLVQHAALFSKRVGATLTILRVVEPEEVRDTASKAVESMLAAAQVEATTRVVVGDIVRRAAEAAREEHADLIIVGRGAIREPFARLRNHSLGIIEQSPCPVLSV